MQGKDTRLRPLVQSELGSLLPRVTDPKIQQRYEALLQEASIAIEKRDYGAAIARANEAIALDPDIGYAYASSGYGYAEMQNWGRAKSRLRKAIELLPDNTDLRQYLGTVYLRTGDYDEAEKILDEALRLAPESWGIYADRAMVRSDAGRKQAALEDASLACSKDSEMGCAMVRSLQRELEDLRQDPD
jgi:tetratricopeptide (TPR) repeat protein